MRFVWSKSAVLMWNCLVVIELLGSVCWAADLTGSGRQRASFARSGGIYAGGCFDGVFGKLSSPQ